ncbi:hypothetical protein [Streptomyces sp. KL116D]|uniref:hypothetical protein n=1 Tax=Streptomyces sp. KL116D TaxID=3045152 RepID=UPI00355697A5
MLPALPVSVNGKIDRAALPEADLAVGARWRPSRRAPRRAAALEIWADVLELTEVGVQDNFYELGGTRCAPSGSSSALQDEGLGDGPGAHARRPHHRAARGRLGTVPARPCTIIGQLQ